MTSCATIVGGSKYNAKIDVVKHSDAEILYYGRTRGIGSATISVMRKDADKFKFAVQKEGCDKVEYSYHNRIFRGWAFAGTIIFWTGITPTGIPLPWGVLVDGLTGSWYKPDVKEPDIQKENLNNFLYVVEYDGCKNSRPKEAEIVKENQEDDLSKYRQLRELKRLLDEGVISKEEFDAEKKRILEEK